MEKLRSEIRAAFEKEQSAHPPIAALRHNVVEAVTAKPRREPNYQWVALAAALVIGALVVVGLVSTRLAHRGPAPANPRADYGPPPAAVQLLYVSDPNHPGWLIGYDWSGKPRGTVKFDKSTSLSMAPDGSRFASPSHGKGGYTEFFDRLGQPIPNQDSTGPLSHDIWADDSRHVCSASLDPVALTYTLITLLPGEPKRSVTVIARDQNLGQTGISLASCSFLNDQAVAVRTTIAWPSELWVIRLSDGKILRHATYSDAERQLLANVIVSRDASLMAENSARSTGQLGVTATSTLIRRVADGSVVATLSPEKGVVTFSGDDSLVLVTTTPLVDGVATALAVIETRSGQVRWTYQGSEVLGGFLAEPDGPYFTIALKGTGQVTGPERDILIVRASGSEIKISGRYVPTW